MTNLLLVLSKDPYSTEIPDLVIDIASNSKEKGNNVALYLVEDGVTATRKCEFGDKIMAALKKGIKVYADDKAVLARGLSEKLIDGVETREIGSLLDFIMDEYERVAWL